MTTTVRHKHSNALGALLPSCLSSFGARARRLLVKEPHVQRVLVALDRLARTEDGQDLLEYGMIVVLIAVGAVVAVTSVGSTINAVLWQAIAASNY